MSGSVPAWAYCKRFGLSLRCQSSLNRFSCVLNRVNLDTTLRKDYGCTNLRRNERSVCDTLVCPAPGRRIS